MSTRDFLREFHPADVLAIRNIAIAAQRTLACLIVLMAVVSPIACGPGEVPGPTASGDADDSGSTDSSGESAADGTASAPAKTADKSRPASTADSPLIRELPGHENWINTLALSPDGTRLVSAESGETNAIHIWNAQTGELMHRMEVDNAPRGFSFAPDGKSFAAFVNGLKQWELETGKLLCESDKIDAKRATFASDGRLVCAGSLSGMQVWNPASGEQILKFDGGSVGSYCANLDLTPDERYVVCAANSDMIGVWELDSGTFVRRIDCGSDRFLESAFLTPDGRRFLSMNPNGQLRLRDFASGQLLREFDTQGMRLRAAAFSPDGEYLLGVLDRHGYETRLVRWRLETGRIIDTLALRDDDCPRLAVSADGRRAVTAGDEEDRHLVRIWALPVVENVSDEPLPKIIPHASDDGIPAVQFSARSTLEVPSNEQVFDINDDFTIESWVQHGAARRERETIVGDDLDPNMRSRPRPLRTAGWALHVLHSQPDAGHYRWEFTVAGQATDWLRLTTEPIPYDDAAPWPWHHLALVRHGGQITLYVDGRAAGQAPIDDVLIPSSAPITLGTVRRHVPPTTYYGRMRGLHITQSAKYAEDFTPPSPLEQDEHSALLYDFSAAENRFADRSGNEHHAIPSERWEVDGDLEYLLDDAERRLELSRAVTYLEQLHDRARDSVKWEISEGKVKQGPRSLRAALLGVRLLKLRGRIGDYARSPRAATEVLESIQANAAPQSEEMADALEAAGVWALGAGETQQAQQQLSQSLAMRQSLHAEDDDRVADGRLALGHCLRLMGREREAEKLYHEALATYEAAPQAQLNAVDAWISLCRLETARGRFDKAAESLNRGEQIGQALAAGDHFAAGRLHLARGELLAAQRSFDEANEQFEHARRILQRCSSPVDVSRVSLAQARSSLQSNELSRVQPLLDEAEELTARRLSNSAYETLRREIIAAQLNNHLLQVEPARLGFDRAYRSMRGTRASYPLLAAQALDGLARSYLNQDFIENSLNASEASLEVKESLLDANDLRLVPTLTNLVLALQHTDRYDESDAYLRRALAIAEAAYGADSVGVAQLRLFSGYCLISRGDLPRAIPEVRRAYDILIRREPMYPLTPSCQFTLAWLYWRTNDPQHVVEVTEQSVRGLVQRTRRTLTSMGQSEQLQFLRTNLSDRRLSVGVAAALESGSPKAAQRSAEWHINCKALMVETLARQLVLSQSAGDDETAKWREQLIRAQGEVVQHAMEVAKAPPGDAPVSGRYRDVDIVEASRRLGSAVQSRIPKNVWVGLKEVRARIPEDAVLIEFLRTRLTPADADLSHRDERHYVAWIIPPADKGDVQMVDLGPARAIENAILEARLRIDVSDVDAVHQSLRTVSDGVLKPLLPHIQTANRWIVCPDVGLWLVPFPALLLDDDRYVVEAHVVSNLSSARDLMRDDSEAASTQPLMLANPDYNVGLPAEAAAGAVPFVPLPGTAREARLVAPSLADFAKVEPAVFTAASATERLVKSAQSPRVLMLSSHGFYEGRFGNPLLNCGIALAGANAGMVQVKGDEPETSYDDDGILTGMEILGMDLQGTQLAVLSACDTGKGRLQAGEGVHGLQQAFLLAGADAVVASLWSIPDEETAALMGAMFNRLAAGSDHAAALCQAQRDLIRGLRAVKGSAHPQLWGAFTLTGRWQSPPPKSPPIPTAAGPLLEVARIGDIEDVHWVRFSDNGRQVLIHYRDGLHVRTIEELKAEGGLAGGGPMPVSLSGGVLTDDAETAYGVAYYLKPKYRYESKLFVSTSEDENTLTLPGNEPWNVLALSPREDLLLLGSRRGGVRLWDIKGQEFGQSFEGIEQWPADLRFSADGSQVFAADTYYDPRSPRHDHLRYTALLAWDRESGELLWRREVEGPSIVLPGNQKVLATRGRELELWDVSSGETIRTLRGHGEPITEMAVSRDGRFAVSCSRDHSLRVWDVSAGYSIQTIRSPAEMEHVAISPDGTHILTSSYREVVLREFRDLHVPQDGGVFP